MAFAQLTYRESLRDSETCLRAHQAKLYHLGICETSPTTHEPMPTSNATGTSMRDFAISLIQIARTLYACERCAVELEQTVYALDTTSIDLCGNIPTLIHISNGKMHEVNVLDILIPEAGSFYIMDRGFTDFARWFALHQAQAFFVTRA